MSLHWRHNDPDSVSNHQPHDCLLNCLFRRRSKKTSKLRVTGLCVGNSPGTGEFPAQMASNAENVSIWWRHHVANIRDTDDLETKGTDHHQSWYWYPGIFRPQYQKDQYVAAEEILLRCSECYIFMNYKSASSFTNATFKCAQEPGPLFTKR